MISLETLFGDPRMVYGQDLDCPVSNEVKPAVSDMGDAEYLLRSSAATTVVPIPAYSGLLHDSR